MDRLADGLAAASLSDTADQSAAAAAAGVPSADYLRSVMRAVEGAEATMRSQVTASSPALPFLASRRIPSLHL
jgi:hypothetical protein